MATGFVQGGSGPFSRGGGVPDPLNDLASLVMPTNMPDVFKWCARIYERMGVYSAAVRRILAYFITDIDIEAPDEDVKSKYLAYLKNELQILTKLVDYGLDFLFTGNEIITPLPPLKWHAQCPNCHNEIPIERMLNGVDYPDAKWHGTHLTVSAACRGRKQGRPCGYQGLWRMQERRSGNDPLVIKRWPPGQIQIFYDELRERRRYVWRIPNDYRQRVKRGELTTIMGLYREVMEAIRNDADLELHDESVFHVAEHRMAEQDNGGWGLPRLLGTFSLAYYVLMLHRYNEAIALDYVVPFRVVTPAAGEKIESEPAWRANMAGNMSLILRMIRERNANPTKWHALPFKVDYTVLGGDATQFAPKDLLEQGYDLLLNAIGTPVEFYKANLAANAAGPSLRLFEASHTYLFTALNRCLQFVCDAVAQHKGWDKVKAKLVRPTHADDIVKQQTRMQAALNQQISQTTALKDIDADFKTETRRKMEEAKFTKELEQEFQEEQDKGQAAMQLFPPMDSITMLQQQQAAAQQQGGAAGAPVAPGGVPPQPPGGPQGSGQINNPDEYLQAAQQIAQDLLMRDETTRKRYLNQLRNSDRLFSRVVIDELNKLRQQQQSAAPQQAA